MPVYHYKCSDCDCDFEVKHSMSYEEQACIECGSTSVFKIPSLNTNRSHVSHKNKPGAIVDNYIKDAKKELKMEKKKLEREGM
tara:strand:+ start:15075 stop:15323 length:249 start_codon:yes stop_codon:yes gene_type:complete